MTDLSLHCPAPVASGSHARPAVRALLEQAAGSDFLRVGVVAALEGLREVVEWATSGQQADETAMLWLQQLRWARACGLPLDPAAPLPPVDPWEARVPASAAPASGLPDFARTLGRATMQYPARSQDRDRSGPEFLPFLAPLVLHPQDSLVHLGQLAVNATALTHGHPEALASALVWVLSLRCGAAEGTASREWGAAGLPRVQDLLDTEEPDGAGRGGLMAAMAATGGSVRALRTILAAAPATLRAVRGLEPEDEEPGCVVALRRALAGKGLTVPGPEDAGTASEAVTKLLGWAQERWLASVQRLGAQGQSQA